MLVLQPLFGLLGWLVVLGIYIVIIPLAYVIQWLLYLLLQLLQPNPLRQPPQPLQPSSLSDLLAQLFGQQLSPEVIAVAKAVGALMLLALALLLVARAASHWRPTRVEADAVAEERESLWQPGALRRALLAWLRRWWSRRRTRAGAATAAAEAGPARVMSVPLSSVRALYRQLLRLGEASGARRAGSSTPYEHLPALQRSLEPAAEVAEVTEAYVRARYAEQEPAPDEVERLRARLTAIHAPPPEPPTGRGG
jgi:hypothetical protein